MFVCVCVSKYFVKKIYSTMTSFYFWIFHQFSSFFMTYFSLFFYKIKKNNTQKVHVNYLSVFDFRNLNCLLEDEFEFHFFVRLNGFSLYYIQLKSSMLLKMECSSINISINRINKWNLQWKSFYDFCSN